jgi:hypothetical protein
VAKIGPHSKIIFPLTIHPKRSFICGEMKKNLEDRNTSRVGVSSKKRRLPPLMATSSEKILLTYLKNHPILLLMMINLQDLL